MDPITNETLQCYLDGELDEAEATAMAAALAVQADAQARLRALQRVREAVDEALADQPGDRAALSTVRPRRRTVRWLGPLLAAAAAVVVGLVAWLRPPVDAATARNEYLELRVAPHGGGARPLFTDVAFDFFWTPKAHLRLDLLPHGFRTDLDALAGDTAAKTGAQELPLVLTARLTSPSGTQYAARWFGESLPIAEAMRQRVSLADFLVEAEGLRDYLGGRPAPDGWIEDFRWAFRDAEQDASCFFVPNEPGEWRVAFEVRPLPAVAGAQWPQFSAPLTVQTAVVLGAEVSPWSEPHDGMRARLVVAGGVADPMTTPIALQLENVDDKTRRYNVTGVTMVKIPQPLHFTLLVDGEPWEQRDDLGVIVAAGSLLEPHEPGGVRTLVVMPGYWRSPAGQRLSDLPGARRLQIELHFEPLTWVAGDREMWRGKVRTPELQVTVPGRR